MNEKPLKNQIEYRTFNVNYRKDEENEKRVLGTAALYEVRTDFGYFYEEIAPGAFSKALPLSDTRALFNHDPNYLLARKRKAGSKKHSTLEIKETENGLDYSFDMPESQTQVREMLERGDLDQSSFAFTINPEGIEWRTADDGKDIRRITEIKKLHDVSMVVYPQYEEASAAFRSFEAHKNESEEIWKEREQYYKDVYGDKAKREEATKEKPKKEVKEEIKKNKILNERIRKLKLIEAEGI